MRTKIMVIIFVSFLMFSLFSTMFIIKPVKADLTYVPFIETWGEQAIVTTGDVGNLRFPSVALAPNGDLVCIYIDAQVDVDHCCDNEVMCVISSDYGETWGTPYEIFSMSTYLECIWSLRTAPNGDLIFMRANHSSFKNNGTDIWRNSNNGAEGYWSCTGNFSEFDECYVYDWIVFGDNIYAFMNDPHLYTGTSSKIVYSDDNGSTWNTMGNSIGEYAGEWCAIPTDANAQVWTTVNRFTSEAAEPSSPSACGEPAWNGGGNYEPFYEQWNTTDGGSTWNDMDTNCPDECGDSYQESNTENKGPYLWWLDDECIVANIESGTDATFYINIDNMSTAGWGNQTTLGPEGSAGARNAYSRGCALPKRGGNVGGWGYIVWSEQSNDYIMGCWVANNASLVWLEPAGPIDYTGEWNSINNVTDGETTTVSTRTYNGSSIDETVLFYQVQVANDSGFSDTFIDIECNSTNQGDFVDNGVYWYATDGNTFESYGGTHGTHYYRYRPRYFTVTT